MGLRSVSCERGIYHYGVGLGEDEYEIHGVIIHCDSDYNDTYVWGRNIPLRRHMRTILYQIIEK